jgi:biopolymer transport protein ExbD
VVSFRRGLKLSGGFSIDLVPLVNVLFLAGMFYAVSFYFTRPAPINVKLPKAVTSDIVQDKITIVITSENIIYFDNKVTTLKELRALLSRPENRKRPVFIKADRRASVGRIVDIWDLGRGLEIRRIDVATD